MLLGITSTGLREPSVRSGSIPRQALLPKMSCPLLTLHLSILYKTKLPFILVFNKTDVRPHDFAVEWMHDFEAFQAALASHQGTTDDEGEPTYMNSLMNSMSLVLDEFYKHLTVRVRPRALQWNR